MPTDEEIQAAEQARLDAEAQAAAASQPSPEEIAAKAAVDEEAHRQWAERNGYAPKADVGAAPPDTGGQVDPNADLVPHEEEVKRLRAEYRMDDADKLQAQIIEEKAVRRATAALMPMVAGGVVDQIARKVCDGLPEEAVAHFKKTYGHYQPQQLVQLAADPVFSGTVRDSCEINAERSKGARAMHLESVAARSSPKPFTESQSAAAAEIRKAYPHLNETEIAETIKEAQVG